MTPEFKKTVSLEASIPASFALISNVAQLRIALMGLNIKVENAAALPPGTPTRVDEHGTQFYDTDELLKIAERAITIGDSHILPDVLGLRTAAENIIRKNQIKQNAETLRDDAAFAEQVREALRQESATPAATQPTPRPHRRAELAQTVVMPPYKPPEE